MKTLLIALLTMGTVSSFAGLPSEDPIVEEMRNQFIEGTLPSKEDLQKSYECKTRSATRGVTHVSNFTISFSENHKVYVMKSTNSNLKNKVLRTIGNELIGDYSNDTFHSNIAFRITPDRALSLEWGTFEYKGVMAPYFQSGNYIEGIADPTSKAAHYGICTPITQEII